nr:TonB-dependent vitamin B12 receptor [Vulcaniibacterium gelatinicum]
MQHRTLCLAIALGLPSLAAAQSAPTDLDEVVVTGTRTAVTVDESLAPVEVIGREEIERSQAHSLPDLLRGRAGISLSNQGGAGKLTTLFLRGAESDHVLVLVDGVRVGSATSGLTAFQDLPLALIERIEIVRGPRSSLYGSEAIGGVIQIFTRRDREGLRARASATLGSHGRAEGSAGFGGGLGRGWFGVDAAYQNVEGFDACEVATPSPFSGGCFIFLPEPDADGYRNRSLSLRGGVDAGETLQVDLHALRAEGRNVFDGDFTNLSKTVQQVLGGRATWTPSERLRLQLVAGRNTDSSDQYLTKPSPWVVPLPDGTGRIGWFQTDRDSATLQGDLTLARGQLLTLGVDWLRDHVAASTTYARAARANRAGFVQYQGRFGRHDLLASLRRDDNDQFGGHTTGSAAWGLDLADGWRVIAGYGTAFKAPTFNELYYPFFGNPALRPEEADSAELGLAWRGARGNARLSAFRTEADDLITYDAALGRAVNLERARIRGAELTFDARVSEWTVAGSLSVADSENRATGLALPRRARHGARLELDRAFGALRIGLTAVGEGARWDDVANTRRLGGYATFDLRAEYAFSEALTLQARVANAFDRDYATVAFYRQPGREWLLTLRYSPQR